MPTFTAASSAVAEGWDHTTCPRADEWASKMQPVRAGKGVQPQRGRLTPAGWEGSLDLMPSDVSQTQKDKYCASPPV